MRTNGLKTGRRPVGLPLRAIDDFSQQPQAPTGYRRTGYGYPRLVLPYFFATLAMSLTLASSTDHQRGVCYSCYSTEKHAAGTHDEDCALGKIADKPSRNYDRR
ncbi:hypothetical protein CONLIGDRAFT_667694 [Coniochaeta ligniaria NRRL 30616]|uniref:Uncharacterized protein n=1 Tax=Coniochaeta ligniaria NRRL 30616 TaxID=1408157 RepID=A0A1J7IWI3_9PEZI|nr:hypothetical protein CONLIGDRAFT_667694 [Coniochaeta ligniaria NRRL 30616]